MLTHRIPFNWPYMTGKELAYIDESRKSGCLAGDGPFTKKCHEWLEVYTSASKALLTHSCTAALEMAALLIDLLPGDEVIMPSYTFVSTANAFVLRGAIPVFVDVREETLNLDERLLEAAITPRTRAIVPVHYAGVACEMKAIMATAKRYDLKVIEDAAQGFMSHYQGRALGSIGDFGAYSFHETKNVISGEGGAILINDPQFILRAEMIREKGTDRSRFFRGEIDKYTWQEIGSSFLPGELIAAFLWAQLEEAERITKKRIASWRYYHQLLAPLEAKGMLRRPIIPEHCTHNGHLYYVLLAPEYNRQSIINQLRKHDIHLLFHYVPLHSSPAGKRFGRAHGVLDVTERYAEQLIRLPLWMGLRTEQQERIVQQLEVALR